MALTSTGTGTGSENDVVVSYGLVRLQKSNEAAGDSSTHFPNQMIRENASKQSQQGVSLNSIFGSAHTGESSNTPGTQTVVRTKHILIPVLTYDDVLRAFYVAITSLSKEDQMTVTACFKKELGLSPKDTKASSQKTNTNTNIRDSTISNQTHLMNTVTVSECNSRQSGECRASDENMTDCDVDASENYVTDEIGKTSYPYQGAKGNNGNEPSLNQHSTLLNSRAVTKSHQCQECKKLFPSMSSLRRHQVGHTGEKPYECKVCKKRFPRKGSLTMHQIIHTGVRRHQCLVCSKTFMFKGDLTRHQQIHSRVGTYQCNLCEKQFVVRRDLNRHQTIHTGEKNYQCEFCGKSFRRANSLIAHRKFHIEERPYLCKICGERYSEALQLTSHRRIHTGKYQCDICGKKFLQASEFNQHCKRHNEQSTWCNICNKKYSQSYRLNLHYRRVHMGTNS